ncbi:MAG: amidohydrolase [Oligosphaeraceae bacterium]|nr:amidohydrolase [Oligosphaeraceae bacterium]
MDYEIIDAHLHPFLHPDCCINQYQAVQTVEGFVAHLRQQGISLCAGSIVRKLAGDDFTPIRALNQDALEFRQQYPGFYLPGAHVHSQFPDESCQELERLHAQGVRLIGELVPYYMAWDAYAVSSMNPVWDLASQLGYVVSIHPTTLEDIEQLLTLFPKLNVIIAHPGERADYLQKLALLKRHPNAYLDICGTGLFRHGMLAYGVKEVGVERFLFGSDFPVCSAAMQVGGVLGENLTRKQREAIFAGNARKLFAL